MANKKLRRAAPETPAPRPRREVPRVTADPEQGLTARQVRERQEQQERRRQLPLRLHHRFFR